MMMLARLRAPMSSTINARTFSTSKAAMKTLYVGNLPWTIKDEDLKQVFAEFGEVSSSRVVVDRLSGRSRGFGFVDLVEDSAAAVAIEEMNGKELEGRALTVNESQPREPGSYQRRDQGYGGDRGGYQQRSYDRDDRRGSGGYPRRDYNRGGDRYDRGNEGRGRGNYGENNE